MEITGANVQEIRLVLKENRFVHSVLPNKIQTRDLLQLMLVSGVRLNICMKKQFILVWLENKQKIKKCCKYCFYLGIIRPPRLNRIS